MSLGLTMLAGRDQILAVEERDGSSRRGGLYAQNAHAVSGPAFTTARRQREPSRRPRGLGCGCWRVRRTICAATGTQAL